MAVALPAPRPDGEFASQYRWATSQSRSAIMTSAKGLEGVVVATTNISHVFGEEGRLVYSGYEISELAGRATFEEVCFLVWKGRLPKRSELDELQRVMQPHPEPPAAGQAKLPAMP